MLNKKLSKLNCEIKKFPGLDIRLNFDIIFKKLKKHKGQIVENLSRHKTYFSCTLIKIFSLKLKETSKLLDYVF